MFFPKITHTREEFLPKGNMCEKNRWSDISDDNHGNDALQDGDDLKVFTHTQTF